MCILENSLTLSSYNFHIFQSFLKLPLRALKKSAKYNTLIDVFDTFVFAVISDRGASIADRKLPVKPVFTELKVCRLPACARDQSEQKTSCDYKCDGRGLIFSLAGFM